MKSKRLLILLLLALIVPWAARAQSLTDYTFATDVTTFNSIVSTGTQMSFSTNDDGYAICNFPFAFLYGESSFAEGASIACSANGFIYLGANSTSGTTGAYSSTTNRAVNAILQQDGHLGRYTGDDPSGAWYKHDATAGTFTIEYHKLGTYNGGNSTPYDYGSYSYQVVFHASGDIEFIYDDIELGNADSHTLATYLTDGPKSDRVFVTGAWADPTISTSYAARPTSPLPEQGLRYTFTRPVWTCFKPGKPVATLTPGNGRIATLTWVPNPQGTETAWVLQYGTDANFTEGTYTEDIVQTTPSKDLTGLTAEQTYYARVKPDCDTDGTKWSATCEFKPSNVRTISVYDDPSTLTTNSYFPLYSYSQDYAQRAEYIIPAADLASINGNALTSITLYANYNLTTGSTIVYLMEVPEATFSSTSFYGPTTASTIVYQGALTISSTDGMTVEFTNAYDYNGGNLLIGFAKNYTNGYASGSFRGQNVTGASISAYSDYYYNFTDITAGTQRNFIPKTTIGYTTCSPVKNLTLSELSNEGATFTWEAPKPTVTGYKYQYKEENGVWTTLTSTTALSAPLTGLTANTNYTFQVQAIYSDGESVFVSKDFKTDCDAYPIPYPYGFEDLDDMDCWDLVNGGTTTGVWDNATMEYNFGYEPARTGDYSFMFYYVDYPDTDPEYQTLISPTLTGIENGLHVEFYYVGDLNGSGQETFRVGYSTTNKNLNSFIWGDEITNASTEYQRFSANYPAGTKYVAVQHTSDDQYYLFLDDFTFEEAAACLEPTNVTYDNVTTTGADISWNAGGEETAWDIFVTDDATVEPDDETTPTYANVNSNENYPISNLTQATTYYVYVRAICDENSAWSVPAIFHTECEGMPLPYGPYSFEDGALSVCWNVINTNTSYNSVSVVKSNPNTGTHSLAFYRGSDTGDLVAVLPEVGAYNLSGYQFEFSTKGANAGYQITVGIMTDPEDLATFEAQGDMITTTTSYADYKVRFNEYTGTGKYVAIKVVRPSTVTYGNSFVDDIAINPIPSCLEPEDLVVSDETTHGATFAWTAGAATQTAWQLYFSTTNVAPADDIALTEVFDATSNPFTLESGLTPDTDYYVWVRANCGTTDGNSIWVGPETFTTAIACQAPTLNSITNITGHTATVNWTGTNQSYVLSVGHYDYTATPTETEKKEGFEHSGNMPTGWTHVGNGSVSISNTSTRVHGGTYSLWFSGATSNNVVVLPQFDFQTNTATISFWSLAESSSSSGTFQVGYVTDATDANTFQVVGDYNAGDHLSYTHVENVSMASAPAGARLAFRHTSASSGYWWWIDDVTITGSVYPMVWTEYSNIEAQTYPVAGLDPTTLYYAKVKGYCGADDGYSRETEPMSFTTDVACPAPASFQVVEHSLKHNEVSLSWPADATAWQLCVNDATPYINIALTEVSIEEGVATYVLGSLTPETDYSVKLRADCTSADDGYSEWTEDVEFTTLSVCAAPEPLSASEIDYFSATLNWTGLQENYNVQYRTVGTNDLTEDFSGQTPVGYSANDGQLPDGWYSYNSGTTGYAPRVSNRTQYGQSFIVAFGDNNNFLLMTTNATDQYAYAIMPQYSHILSASFDCAYENTSCGTLTVGYVTDNTGYSTYVPLKTPEKSKETVTHVELSAEDLATINSNNGYIAFRYQSGSGTYYSVGIDDVVIQSIDVTNAGQWQSVDNIEGFTTPIADLTHGTNYEWQVQGINGSCGDNGVTDWSESAFFTTLIDTQTIELTEGWNWVSIHLVYDDPTEALQALEAGLGDHALQISSDNDGFTEYDDGEWIGDLDDIGIFNEQMYLILAAEDCTVELEGLRAIPAQYSITIYPGWNWIGFPSADEIDVNVALANFEAEIGDMIASQSNGVTEYDEEWIGDLETFVPGQGYLYFSASEYSKTLVINTTPVAVARKSRSVHAKVIQSFDKEYKQIR